MLKWGILGTANIAKTAVIPAILSISEQQLIAVSSRSENTATNFANVFDVEGIEGYQNLLNREDIDAVYIPLPTGLHYEWVMKSLEAGKHVLVEKAAAENYDQVEEMVLKAREKKLALVEHFHFAYHSQHKYVRDLLADNIIGDIRCFRSSFGFPPFSLDNNIRYNTSLGGGSLLDAGAYTFKAVQIMLGNDFIVSDAYLSYHEKFGVDWYGGGTLLNKKTNQFAQLAFGFDNYYQCNYEIWGSKGKITSTRAFTAKPDFKPSIIIELPGKTEEKYLAPDNAYKNTLTSFYHNIKVNNLEPERDLMLKQSKLIEDFRNLHKTRN